MSDPRIAVDQRVVRRRLQKAGQPPVPTRFLHGEVGARLLEPLHAVRLDPAVVVDVSAAVGSLLEPLRRHYPRARALAVEEARSPLVGLRREARWRWRRPSYLCAAPDALPLPAASAGLVASNLALHRYPTPDAALEEFHRVLAAGGLLMLSTFGPDTMTELAAAWKHVDDDLHVHPFADMHDLGDALVRAGFSDVVMSAERLTLHYPSLAVLHADLRALGVTCAAVARARSLRTPRQLARVDAAYESQRGADGLPVSVEVVYAHAWRPSARSVSVSFASSRMDT